jgi:putative NADH-flavin reductase
MEMRLPPEVRVGSVMDPAALESAVHGRDAVLSTLGSHSVRDLFGATLMTKTMQALVPAMERQGVSRLIVLSAGGVGEAAHQAPALIRIGFRTLLRQIAKDKAGSEDYVRGSGLDWTIVYPPVLTNGPLTKEYRVGEDLRLKGGARIRRADVAQFMLAQLEDSSYSRKNAIISS